MKQETEEEDNDRSIDIHRFRQHKRRIPWGLIAKIIVATGVGFVIYYGYQQMRQKQKPSEEIQLEIEQ
jgi:hypothetical protein